MPHASYVMGMERREYESCIPIWTTLPEASISCKKLIKSSYLSTSMQMLPCTTELWLLRDMLQELKIKGIMDFPFRVGQSHNVILKHLKIKEMQRIPTVTKLGRLAVSSFLGVLTFHLGSYIID